MNAAGTHTHAHTLVPTYGTKRKRKVDHGHASSSSPDLENDGCAPISQSGAKIMLIAFSSTTVGRGEGVNISLCARSFAILSRNSPYVPYVCLYNFMGETKSPWFLCFNFTKKN